MTMTTQTTLFRLLVLFALPARLTHELLHVIPALLWAERVQVEILPQRGDAVAKVKWLDDAPGAVIAFSAIAPLVAACVAAFVALWGLLTGAVQPPGSVSGLALLAILAAFTAMVGQPSAQDLRAFWGGRDG